jgi:hypothetical protein
MGFCKYHAAVTLTNEKYCGLCVEGDAVKVNVLEAPHHVAAPPVYQQAFRPATGQFNKVITCWLCIGNCYALTFHLYDLDIFIDCEIYMRIHRITVLIHHLNIG